VFKTAQPLMSRVGIQTIVRCQQMQRNLAEIKRTIVLFERMLHAFASFSYGGFPARWIFADDEMFLISH